MSKDEVTIISYLTDKSDADTFAKVADAMREDAAFGHFSGSGSAQKDKVVLHRPSHLQSKMEETDLVFEGKVTKDALTSWVKANYHGLVGHRTFDNAKDFKSPLVIAYYDVDYVKNPKGTNYWRNRVMKVGEKAYNSNISQINHH